MIIIMKRISNNSSLFSNNPVITRKHMPGELVKINALLLT